MNSIFLDTLQGKACSRPPVWFHRQAGRVLPNYRALKENYSFSELMEDPQLAAEVTLMPIHDLGSDAAILFSDILVVPEALGLSVDFTEQGPIFGTPLHKQEDPVGNLKRDMDKLSHVYKAIDAIRAQRPVDTPLIGFCGGPLTTFCFMFRDEVRDITFPHAIEYLYKYPKESKQILEALTEVSIEYALEQVAHGVEAFELFETYGGLIPEQLYVELILPMCERILTAVRAKGIPTIYFPKDLGMSLNQISPDMANFVSVDWQMSIHNARTLLHPEIGIQGNIDPRLLYANQDEIIKQLEKNYLPFGEANSNWVINLGHGILPDLPVENVKCVIDWIKTVNWNR